MSRTYPYKAWVIQPSGRPKEVELVRAFWGIEGRSWDMDARSVPRHVDAIYATRDEAIVASLAALDVQQAKLTKQQTTLDKKRATLIAAREKA